MDNKKTIKTEYLLAIVSEPIENVTNYYTGYVLSVQARKRALPDPSQRESDSLSCTSSSP